MSDATITIFHNLAWGTSRNTLALFRACGVEPVVVDFLLNRPIVATPLGTRPCRPSEAVLDVQSTSQLAQEDGEPVIDAKGRRVAS